MTPGASIRRMLGTAVLATALLLSVQTAGVFLSMRDLTRAVSSLHRTQADLARLSQARQTTAVLLESLERARGGREEIESSRLGFETAYHELTSLLDGLASEAGGDVGLRAGVSEVARAAEQLRATAARHYASGSRSLPEATLLLARQAQLEASEAAGRARSSLEAREDREFELIYGRRHAPLIATATLGTALVALAVTAGLHLTRRIEALGRQLEERNQALTAANRELEAFSYSVSHDLRAPLRSLDGFSKALVRLDHGQLDPKSRDYLTRIRESAQRMGRLIDDLLDLSRLGRQEMRKEAVDLSALAQKVSAELQRTAPERPVEWVIQPGVAASGDPHLLQIALENLLGNAWKYTSHHPRARIEFGQGERQGRRFYFVKDDGAGFDMSYSDKLFVPFQRLHGMKEFPGTGVGLALVKRIVHRHGGEVWGKGETEKGAEFDFTLDGSVG